MHATLSTVAACNICPREQRAPIAEYAITTVRESLTITLTSCRAHVARIVEGAVQREGAPVLLVTVQPYRAPAEATVTRELVPCRRGTQQRVASPA